MSNNGRSLLLAAEARRDDLSSCLLAPTSMAPYTCQGSRGAFWILIANFHPTRCNQFSLSDVLPACLTSAGKILPGFHPSDPQPVS